MSLSHLTQVRQYASSCCSNLSFETVKNNVVSGSQKVGAAVYDFFAAAARFLRLDVVKGYVSAACDIAKHQFQSLPYAARVGIAIGTVGALVVTATKAFSSYFPAGPAIKLPVDKTPAEKQVPPASQNQQMILSNSSAPDQLSAGQ